MCRADCSPRSLSTPAVLAVMAVGLALLVLLSHFTGQGYHLSILPVTVRPITSADPSFDGDEYFGFSRNDMKTRDIAVVSGPFSLDTSLSARLFLVRAGAIEAVNQFGVGRSRNRPGSPTWQILNIRLALGDKDLPGGRVTNLGSFGHSTGGGGTGETAHNIHVVATKTLATTLVPGTSYVVHVEGDQSADFDRNTSIEDFAKRNQGNYLVVVIRLNK